jgi:hypothetical protein
MSSTPNFRDERTTSVENASYRLAFRFLSFGLLLAVMYRRFVRHEQAWDLMALVICSGLIASSYQALQRALTRQWLAFASMGAVIAVIIGVAIALMRR